MPFMVDSSKWSVIEAGLKCLQGKGIANSISLKEGEEDFLAKAREDPALRRRASSSWRSTRQGQAETVDRKVAICRRAYDLLTRKAGWDPTDVVFDPNILAIATGIEEHSAFAKQLHRGHAHHQGRLPRREGLRRRQQPLVLVPRQQPRARGDALGVPLPRHQGRHGHGHRQRRADRRLRGHPQGAARARGGRPLRPPPDATERLVTLAETVKGQGKKKELDLAWRDAPVEQRLTARARARHRRLHRGRRRGGAAEARRGRSTSSRGR